MAPAAPKTGYEAVPASPVTTLPAPSTPCWSSAVHSAGAVEPAQATKTRSGPPALTCRANGVRSVALGGASTEPTFAPFAPSTAFTAATLAWPNVESCARTVTFLPPASPSIAPAVRMSW